jgi:aromatic ring hydroxylase-like protein
VVSGRRLPHFWVSPQLSTLDLVTGTHLILTADGGLGARAARAADAAGLPATVRQLEQPHMRRLGTELLFVRPDQVISAVWPEPAPDQHEETEFLDTTMAMLCGRPGAEAIWTRSH